MRGKGQMYWFAICVCFFISFATIAYMGAHEGKAAGKKEEIDLLKYMAERPTPEEQALGVDYQEVDVEELQDVKTLGCVEVLYPASEAVPLDSEIQQELQKLCEEHEISYPLVLAVMERECHFKEEYEGEHVGLMQVSRKWCAEISKELGVSMMDTLGSAEVGICYLSLLLKKYDGEPALALMEYNMGGKALEVYRKGYVSEYARDVLQKAERWEKVLYGD